MSDSVVLVVRRGALKRFEALNRKAAHLQVKVVWDRRERARRSTTLTPAAERRNSDRRQRDPFTWKAADFLVALPSRRVK